MRVEINGKQYYFPGPDAKRRKTRTLTGLLTPELADSPKIKYTGFYDGSIQQGTDADPEDVEGRFFWLDGYLHHTFATFTTGSNSSNAAFQVRKTNMKRREGLNGKFVGVYEKLPIQLERGFAHDRESVWKIMNNSSIDICFPSYANPENGQKIELTLKEA